MARLVCIFLSVLLAVCLLMALGLGIYIATRPKDIPPFDDSHLYRPVETLPDDQNAFTYYMRAADAYKHAFSDRETERDLNLFFAIIEGDKWDEEFVQHVLLLSEDIFDFVKEGNLRERCIVPRVSHFEESVLYPGIWANLSHLYAFKVRYAIQTGQSDVVIDTLSDLFRFALLTESDTGSMIQYLSNTRMRMIGLDSVHNTIRSGILDTESLLSLLYILQNSPPSTKGLVLAYQTEYERLANTINSLTPDEMLGMAGWSGLPDMLHSSISRFHFYPNLTKQNLAVFVSSLIDQVENTYATTHTPDMEDQFIYNNGKGNLTEYLTFYLTPNRIGSFFYENTTLYVQTGMRYKFWKQVSHRATVLMTALHIYKQNTGSFPESLDALVPDILQEIPLDPFDGKPMRYNPEKGIVYSVGTNLIDFGGSQEFPEGQEQRGRFNQKDIVFEIL